MRLAVLFLWGVFAAGQQIGQTTEPAIESSPTFTASTQFVVETVTVLDKGGKPVDGLRAQDFSVTENGIPQAIRLFEHQSIAESPTPMPGKPEHVTIYDRLTHTQISPERAGTTRYRNRRLLALYFDMTAMQQEDQLRALSAAKTFIRNQLTTGDLLAILRYSGSSVDVLQDFTGNRDRLLSIIQTMTVGESQGYYESGTDASTADTGAAFGQDDSEFNIFNSDRQLAALQTAAQMLGRLSEKKSLIYFAGGLRLNGRDNQAQLHATINSAIRAGVSFWPIDARGLVAEAPLGDAPKGSPGGIGMYSGDSALANTTTFQRSQDTLFALAADTGGKSLLDYNDLTKGIAAAANALSSYYVIGYNTSNTAPDGKFRRVKITLNKNLAARLDYRQGYFAPKRFSKFTAADKERQLEDALLEENPITDLTMAMELDYFQLNRAEYFVPLVVKIPGRELTLAKRGGSEHTLIDFIGEIKDDYGYTITNLRDKVDIKLSDSTAVELSKRPIEYDTGFTLLPGKYQIKLLARDNETGRIGTYETKFTIPNLNKEQRRVPISSVVLSSQRVALVDALYNTKKNKDKLELTNPLVESGRKLIPSVTRFFSRNREMFVYLQAYQPSVSGGAPLLAYVTLYREEKKAFETPTLEVKQGLPDRLHTVPLSFAIPLNTFAPGRYQCQVTVLDPMAQKAAFWQAPVVIGP